jgi:hypothetical protein
MLERDGVYVAEGCVFSTGRVAVAWLGGDRRVEAFDSAEAAAAAHCSDGRGRLVVMDLEATRGGFTFIPDEPHVDAPPPALALPRPAG